MGFRRGTAITGSGDVIVAVRGQRHAIKNPSSQEAAYIVVHDQPYNYEEPDDWLLPPGSDAIPFALD